MRKIISTPSKALFSFSLFLIISVLIFYSCRKIDIQRNETTKVNDERFFNSHRSTEPLVQSISGFMKRKNTEDPFVEKTINQIGYPYWDKAISVKGLSSHRGATDSAEITYIPFVRDSQNFVNASLIIKTTSADTTFRYLCDWQYSDPDSTGWSPRNVFHIFAKLDQYVFNRNKFRITDPDLLTTEELTRMNNLGLTFDSALVIYALDSSQTTSGRNNLWMLTTWCDNIYTCIQQVPPPSRGFRSNTTTGSQVLSECPSGTWLVTEVCTDTWVYIPSSGGGTSGGGTGGSGGGSGGGGGGSGPPSPPCGPPSPSRMEVTDCGPGWEPPPIAVEITEVVFDFNSSPGIDLQKYLNCFANIPDAGATYTVKLCADLPRNNYPTTPMNGLTPGHVFLTLTKTNGSQSITQSFGFYPVNGMLSTTMLPVNSKIVDDGSNNHEYNASISMNVSDIDFNAVKNLALSYANSMQYDLSDFNCTDYALDCFNIARPTPITIDPLAGWEIINNTPNMLYIKLKAMKNANGPEAANIEIGVFNAPSSHGPCN